MRHILPLLASLLLAACSDEHQCESACTLLYEDTDGACGSSVSLTVEECTDLCAQADGVEAGEAARDDWASCIQGYQSEIRSGSESACSDAPGECGVSPCATWEQEPRGVSCTEW